MSRFHICNTFKLVIMGQLLQATKVPDNPTKINIKGLFTPSESKRESESENDQRTIVRDLRKNFKHERKFSLLSSRSLSLGVNGPLHIPGKLCTKPPFGDPLNAVPPQKLMEYNVIAIFYFPYEYLITVLNATMITSLFATINPELMLRNQESRKLCGK